MLMVGLLELAGALSGARNPLEPLSKIRSGSSIGGEEQVALRFASVRSSTELDSVLQSTASPVMLDFYADWCVSCKELEHRTFNDPAVMKQLASMTLLQVDVTANSEDDRFLMKRFGVFGPPAICFLTRTVRRFQVAELVGFRSPDDFLRNPGLR